MDEIDRLAVADARIDRLAAEKLWASVPRFLTRKGPAE
jgi:hypothetical protein